MPSSTAKKGTANKAISNAQRSIAKKVYIPKNSRQKVRVTTSDRRLVLTSSR